MHTKARQLQLEQLMLEPKKQYSAGVISSEANLITRKLAQAENAYTQALWTYSQSRSNFWYLIGKSQNPYGVKAMNIGYNLNYFLFIMALVTTTFANGSLFEAIDLALQKTNSINWRLENALSKEQKLLEDPVKWTLQAPSLDREISLARNINFIHTIKRLYVLPAI